MFCLSLIEHDLRLPPHLLSLPLLKAVRGELERLFLDKVISNLGLCVSVYDIQSIEGGFILPGDGASTYKVAFRLVMFRPFIGEVLVGKIEASDESGLKISLGFFNDIHVPAHLLQQPSSLGEDGIWNWKVSGELLPLDLDEEIRFRVSNVKYPPVPVRQEENAKPFAPMEITDISCDLGTSQTFTDARRSSLDIPVPCLVRLLYCGSFTVDLSASVEKNLLTCAVLNSALREHSPLDFLLTVT